MNIPATLSVLSLIRNPTLCLPHATVPTFAHLPVPLTSRTPTPPSTPSHSHFLPKDADIRAVVLDKDNCFAVPKTNTIHPPYTDKFAALRAAYPGARLLIVSNSAGSSSDPSSTAADALERSTAVAVLRHDSKKPATGPRIMDYLYRHSGPDVPEKERIDPPVTAPEHVAIVGDRLFTDIIMANEMGCYGVWVRDGVVQERGVFTRLEKGVEAFLRRREYVAPAPRGGQFEEG